MTVAPPPLSRAVTGMPQSVFAALQKHIDAYRARGGELIPLHIGDTHLTPPLEGFRTELGELSVYGKVPGLASLREALVGLVRARGLTAYDGAAHVHVGCGCTHALFCAARALLDPGDDVLLASPFWPLFPGVLRNCGVNAVHVPITQRLYEEPEADVRAILEAAITPRTRALYIITPNNPDGQVYDAAALEAMAAFAREHDLWVLSDEVYADFVYDGAHLSIASLEGMAERTVTAYSLSKSHGLAGARIGYVVGATRAIDAVRRVSNYSLYNVPVPMQRAALAAIEAGDGWIDAARERYRGARDITMDALADLGVKAHAPKGGSFVFLDMREPLGERPVNDLMMAAIDRGVLLAPGGPFGTGFERHVRLCFTGVAEEPLKDGIARLGEALESLS